MIIEVSEEKFWSLRGDSGIVYYVENDLMVDLWMSREGYFLHAVHHREDVDLEAEESNMYLIYKQEKLDNAIRVLAVKKESAELVIHHG